MNYESIQTYILPLALILFFAFRFYKFFSIKKSLPKLLNDGAIIVDVRSIAEFQAASNPSSINIPLDQISSGTNKLDKSKTIILCCASGTRSGMALGLLKKNGFKNVVNAGPWTNTVLKD
jgi:rhodanese-related sulfurtransferase